MNPLISAEELSQKLDLDNWAIVDARFYLAEPDRGEREYLEEHVPGAVYAHLDRDLSGTATGANGRHPLPSAYDLGQRLGGWGIDDGVQVVVYDAQGGQIAARLWWLLQYLGHRRAAVLDGGYPAWKSAGHPTRSGAESRAARRFQGYVQDHAVVEVEDLERPSALQRYFLIDARAAERFRGEREPLDPVAGHIPGARNSPSESNLDAEGRFLPAATLKRTYDLLIGDRPVESVVSYCGSGVTACHNLLAMAVAGIEGARLYPGSWSEWCASPNRPIETGEGKRG